jgi:hypothetical protein
MAAVSAGIAPTPKRSRKGALIGIATGASSVTTASDRLDKTSAKADLGTSHINEMVTTAKKVILDLILIRDRPIVSGS